VKTSGTGKLAEMLGRSKHTVVLTGAGMSVESGIPDFRSPSGWWRNIDPLTVATIEALETNYELFHQFYTARIKGLDSCLPHEGHHILATWEERGLVQRVATQNVDGLHLRAGTRHIDELHGSIHTFRCHHCQSIATKEQFLNKTSCNTCQSNFIRPNVVLFGETLPQEAWTNALHHIQQAQLVVVIGTSLQVYPVSQLPSMTRGQTVYLNKEVSGNHREFDFVIEGSAKEMLKEVNKVILAN